MQDTLTRIWVHPAQKPKDTRKEETFWLSGRANTLLATDGVDELFLQEPYYFWPPTHRPMCATIVFQ